MSIRVWRSFSCNNSSSYRLIARFRDPAVAAEAAEELRAFFEAHAQEMDAVMEQGDFPDENPETARALAAKYGFSWGDVLTWGDEMLAGDEPSIATEDGVLVVYHTYCGGFGDGIPAYLRARGAEVGEEDRSPPTVSVLFSSTPGADPELDAQLAEMFAQIDGESRDVEPFEAPWKTRWKSYGTAAFFRDAKTVGLYFPIAPTDLPAFREWLAAHGIERPSIRLCELADEARFVTIAAARCTACHGPLEYLDPRIHDIEHPQLACRTPCGALYELAAFATPA